METQMLTPTPGRDYPRTWNRFLDWFATEEACLAFLGFGGPKASSARVAATLAMCTAPAHPPDVPLMPVPRHGDIWNHL